MQYRDPTTGAVVSLDPAIDRYLRLRRQVEAAAARHEANRALTTERDEARTALEAAEAALAGHEYSRLLAARDAASKTLDEAQSALDGAISMGGAPSPSDYDLRGAERAARQAGWSEEWKPPAEVVSR